jgi:hypothetical protein
MFIRSQPLSLVLKACVAFALAGALLFAATFIQRPLSLGLTAGLVGHWSFDEADLAGTRAVDRSGQGNHGTLTNEPHRTKGKIGQALEFDGSNDYVDAGNATSLDIGTGDYALSAWVKLPGPSAKHRLLVRSGGGTVKDDGILFQINASTGVLELWVANGTSYVINGFAGTTDLRDDQWHHVVWTWDRDVGNRFYIDGVQEAADTTVNSDNILSDGNFTLGGSAGIARSLHGALDDVRIYNRALTADEIARLYKSGDTLTWSPPSPKAAALGSTTLSSGTSAGKY